MDIAMRDEARIVANRIRTPDGTILESKHRHDYVTYTDANGKQYMVDGGLDYLRRNLHDDAPYTELSVYSDAPHAVIREVFKWGTRGKDGKQPLKFVVLKDMTTDHIEAILETQSLPDYMRKIFLDELDFLE
jgi:hypothetical protein